MDAGVAAYRAGNAPHIIQIFEVGTATMMGGKGADWCGTPWVATSLGTRAYPHRAPSAITGDGCKVAAAKRTFTRYGTLTKRAHAPVGALNNAPLGHRFTGKAGMVRRNKYGFV